MLRPCPNPQCSHKIDFTEAECRDCFDAQPMAERIALADGIYPNIPKHDNRSFD